MPTNTTSSPLLHAMTLGPLTVQQRTHIMSQATALTPEARQLFRRLLILAQERSLDSSLIEKAAAQAREHVALASCSFWRRGPIGPRGAIFLRKRRAEPTGSAPARVAEAPVAAPHSRTSAEQSGKSHNERTKGSRSAHLATACRSLWSRVVNGTSAHTVATSCSYCD